jgi:hypothetical protein
VVCQRTSQRYDEEEEIQNNKKKKTLSGKGNLNSAVLEKLVQSIFAHELLGELNFLSDEKNFAPIKSYV